MKQIFTFFRSTFVGASVIAFVFWALSIPVNHLDAASDLIEPPPPGLPWIVSQASSSCGFRNADWSGHDCNFISQAAANNKDTVIQNVEAMLTSNIEFYNETYVGLHSFGGGDDIFVSLVFNVYDLLWRGFVQANSTILLLIACISIIRNRCKRRSLVRISVQVVCLMTFLGLASAADWQNIRFTVDTLCADSTLWLRKHVDTLTRSAKL